ncbi:MAG TPA: energy transducer TonB [Casimicrobium huifangae]|jgi:TonB family protein|uniref:energy transducer TonB n=1 Tax=Casimicrobium huifangae TaxID=2591109 RepID=UPI0012EC2F1D|nr:energy transducer TonB [Casimicrobium huifangae]HOB02371.1 energy transducer TonB [Casimicrobium huifangae]HQA34665.1 energy transducer TonB [Casimicrobium huifangae]HQD66869.1 energy transducer TonB [Casimicrobium huifangae]
MKRLLLVATAALSVSAAGAAFADETNFPARHRTLESTAPSSCGEWVAPLPDRRVKVSLPYDARKREGMARVTFTIGPDGSYAGLVSAQTNDAAFVQAAEQSLQYWTFKAARCNGVAVPIEASMYFNFRNEGFVSYAAGNPIQN